MELNATKYPNLSRVITGASVLFPNDSILLCNTSAAPVSMTLLEIPAGFWQQTWKLYVLDNSNNAGTFSITINAPTGFTINGSASLVINVNGGGCVFTITSDTTFIGQLSYSTGGGGVSSVTASLPLTATVGANPNISMPAATSLADGYLTLGDFNTYYNKSEKVIVSNTAGAVVTPTCTNIKFKTTDFTTTNPSGNIALISKYSPPSLLAQQVPNNNILNLTTLATTIFTAGQIQTITQVLDDGNDYDPLTGFWTFPDDGY